MTGHMDNDTFYSTYLGVHFVVSGCLREHATVDAFWKMEVHDLFTTSFNEVKCLCCKYADTMRHQLAKQITMYTGCLRI